MPNAFTNIVIYHHNILWGRLIDKANTEYGIPFKKSSLPGDSWSLPASVSSQTGFLINGKQPTQIHLQIRIQLISCMLFIHSFSYCMWKYCITIWLS